MKRKLFLFMLAALTATLSAMAEEYIKVSNREMPFTESWTKSYNYFNDASSGSVSWDAANRKLTLNKFSLWRGWELNFVNIKTCIEVYSTQSVTIEVVGFNKIVNFKGQTLALHGNTTFTGNGTLKLGNNDSKKPGMDLLEENIDITVNGPKLMFECSNGGIRGKNNTGTLHLKAGEVQSSSDGKLVTGLANVTWDYGMGVKSPHGAWFSRDKRCMVDMNGKEITSQKVELDTIKYHGFSICGVPITENNYDLFNTFNCIKSGDVHYDPSSNTLYLDNATIVNNSSAPTIQNESNYDLDIQLTGNNIFKFEGEKERWAMSLKENTHINGEFTDEGFLHVIDADYAGIHVGADKCLSLQAVTLNIPYLKGGNIKSSLDIFEDVEINATGNSKLGTLSFLHVGEEMWDDVAVESTVSQPRFYWNRDDNRASGVYANLNELAKGPVHISTKAKSYPVKICGQRVNALNKNNIINQYLKSGRIYYDDEGLHLYNAELDYEVDNFDDMTDPALKFYSDSHIYLEGTNKIKCNDVEAIETFKDLTIQNYASYASLTIEGPNAEIYTSGTLGLIDTKVTAPRISSEKLNVHGSWFNVTRKLGADKVSLSEEKVASTPDAPAYYDSEKQQIVAPKGPVSFLPSSEVTVYDGIQFCGEEINSANHTCVMNKYVDEGSLSVEKVSNGYGTTIRDLIVRCNDNLDIFKFTSLGTVSLNLYGNNQFHIDESSSTGHFIKGDAKNIYINGRSGTPSLTVLGSSSNNAGAISVAANCSLNIYNIDASNVTVSVPRIYGQGTSSTLYVNDPYLTVTGNKLGTVSNVSCTMTTSKTELYNTSSNPREIRSNGIYSNGSLCTEEVKFVKKGESFIPVTSVRVTPKTLSFTKKGETQKLSASVLPNDATNKEVTWASSDESVVTVDQIGNVKAVGSGTTYVYAYPDGKQDDITESGTVVNRCKVTVDIPQPTSIALDQTDVLIDRESIGGFYLTASLTPSNADTEYTWESSDENVVTVRANSGQTALVRRVADEGEATVTVTTSNGKQATCHVTIHYPITPWYVEFAQRTYTLTEVGEQLKLEPIVTPDNCEKLSFTWETSSDAISLSNDGTVTARRNGSAVVECWACYDGQKWAPGEVRINVEIPPTPVIATGLKLKAAHSIFHSLGEAFIITPVFTPENVTNQELAWDTTDASVATVDEDGFVTVVGWGDCYITATTTDGSDIKATYSVTAIDPSTIPDPIYATGIRLDENEVTLMRGEQAYIGVTIEPADYNQSVMIEPMEGDISIAQVDAQWDWNTNRTSIYIRTEEWSEMSGDLKVRVRPNMVDWDKLNAQGIWTEPADTLTIHVLAPIIFAEASTEGIDVTYHVTDVRENTCEVYTQPRPGMTMIDPLDPDLIPAVSQTATGKLTVPARANGYWVTNVMPCAFNRCSGLTEIDFSEGIETIGDYACYSALYSLERVALPSTIKELGQYCFSANPSDYATSEDPSGRNYIHEVNIKSFTPPTGQNGSDINWSSAFYNVASDAVLYVPTGALANYNVEPWTQWFSRIEEKQFFEDPDAIKGISEYSDYSDYSDYSKTFFDLSGRKLGSKPSKPGLYIQGSKKVVIK